MCILKGRGIKDLVGVYIKQSKIRFKILYENFKGL